MVKVFPGMKGKTGRGGCFYKANKETCRHGPKDQNKTPEMDSKETHIHELSDKEFKMTVIQMLNELKEKTDN